MSEKSNRTVRILAKYGEDYTQIVKVRLQNSTIVVSNFQPGVPRWFSQRVEHVTYPLDGRVHTTTDRLDQFPDGIDPDPLKLYDYQGRKWQVAGPRLDEFTGWHSISQGYILVTPELMSGLVLKQAPQPHDLVVEGFGGGVAFGYGVDLVERQESAMTKAIKHRRGQAESVNESFGYHLVTHTEPWILISVRVKGELLSGRR